ncbi:MAG: serine protein kinase PrkA [Myxococcales bacterium]|nr:serine protein kinase PrkA [Myxococcales bacterium]
MTEPADALDATAFLADTVAEQKRRFVERKTLLGFEEYLADVAAHPALHCRDAATYLRDALAYFGTDTLARPYGTYTRYRLFDCAFDDGRDPLIGHEPAQEALLGLLTDFVRDGRVNRLVLLHGPNGSAKSRFVSCVIRGLQAYSERPEGALYTFNWVFPSARVERGNIGFGGSRRLNDLPTFAHLAEGEIDTRIRNELRDHPLLLLPRPARVRLLRRLLGPEASLPDSLAEGEPSPKARQIYDALLKAYKGDLAEVLKHVQVERFFISQRFRQAAVTIDPQMRVDASVRQVTADRSLAALPPSLQNLTLYEPMGDLVDGNRGVIEYNDLLKRPLDAFKYLLSTCENGTARLDMMDLHLDAVFLGSCNTELLAAFKQHHDFASFKARIELVPMPYLVDYTREAEVYRDLLASVGGDLAIGPHVSDVLALWAVLGRVEPALPREGVSTGVRDALKAMTPLQKAMLYAHGSVPADLPRDVTNTLRGLIPGIYRERNTLDRQEGLVGPSPRELKSLLLTVARKADGCLTAVPLFDALKAVCAQTAVYPFLAQAAEGDFHRFRANVDIVREWWLDRVEDELHRAMGLIDDQAMLDLMRRYIDHAVHAVRGEKRINPVTGRAEVADAQLMGQVEERLGIEEKAARGFREGIVHRIGAWRMDHPDDALDYGEIFRDHIARLNEHVYHEKRKQAGRLKRDLLRLLVDEEGSGLDAEARARAEQILTALTTDFGYARPCAVEVIAYLLRHRPEGDA